MTTRKLGAVAAAALGLILMLAVPGGAAAKDRNNDRIPDRWESHHHLSLKVKQTHRDQDRDGLRNRGEFLTGNRPHDRDSDDDGVEDGDENAGTIESFNADSGRLVINLFGGDSLSGRVTADTEIKCEDENEADEDNHDGEHGDDNESEHHHSGNSGPGSDNSGPGHDGEGDEDRNCTTADLTPGRVVEEAELEAHDGAAFFEEVELAD